MARYLGPKLKKRQRFGLAGEGESIRRRRPVRRKKSDYGERLEQKQKLKFIYGLMEKQMKRYVAEAFEAQGDPRVAVMQRLEVRLDNIVFRLGLAKTREQARQLVTHGHILVDDQKLDIPSYKMEPGQKIVVKKKILSSQKFREEIEVNRKAGVAFGHLEYAKDGGRFLALPKDSDLPQDVDISQVLEFYHNIL